MKFLFFIAVIQLCFSVGDGISQDLSSTAEPTELSIPVFVSSAKKGPIKNLSPADMDIFLGRSPVNVLSLARPDGPLSIGILIDLSGSSSDSSNKDQVRPEVKHAISELAIFIEQSHPENEYFFTVINGGGYRSLTNAKGHDSAKSRLDDFANLAPKGNSPFFDALSATIKNLFLLPNDRKALIVISDGQDNISDQISFGDIRELARRENILIYTINANDQRAIAAPLSIRASVALRELSEIAGAASIRVVEKGWFIEWGKPLADELENHFYARIHITPSSDKPKWRDLSMRPTKRLKKMFPDLKLRTRKGIFH